MNHIESCTLGYGFVDLVHTLEQPEARALQNMLTEEERRLVRQMYENALREEREYAERCRATLATERAMERMDGTEADMNAWLSRFTQEYISGGWNVSPETRLMLFALAVGSRANDVLELGYDAGVTLEALALSGAPNVVGVDNLTEYALADEEAHRRLAAYDNVTLMIDDALDYLRGLSNESIDLAHVDDDHYPPHVLKEAQELRRVLRPGGIALFHNNGAPELWDIMEQQFGDWGWMRLPALGPHTGIDFGIAIMRKGPLVVDDGRGSPSATGIGAALLGRFGQKYISGGIHTAPEARLLMYALCKALRAQFVVETGYDAGGTTEALAMTGARVLGVDNLSEYGDADMEARERLAAYDNVELHIADALVTLRKLDDSSVDFIFIDDSHAEGMMSREIQEVKRILRPGGIAAFHDTIYHRNLWELVAAETRGWQCINLPAISPKQNIDFGLGLVRRPVQ